MHFLSIESSTNHFALAVAKGDKILRFKRFPKTHVLEDAIIRHIDTILAAAGLTLKRIDAFALSIGPGSFTSLRVGLSTVKGLCMALDKPLVGVGSLDVIAHGAIQEGIDEICVVTDARRKKVYSALYRFKKEGIVLTKPYQLSEVADVLDAVKGRTLFVGDAIALYKDEIQSAYKKCGDSCEAIFADEKKWLPDVRCLAHLAWQRLKNKDTDDVLKLLPIYLYPSDCQVSR